MILITGDTHGDFYRLVDLCRRIETTKDDVVIILGDAGINYHRDEIDKGTKMLLQKLPLTIFCIHGNHEIRPETIPTYREMSWHGGKVYVQDRYPNILFAKDGEIYDLGGRKTFVCGGAYSVDKAWRTEGLDWWPDEQPGEAIKKRCEEALIKANWEVDAVLTHTCPAKYIPSEAFLKGINQETVDRSTEEWLDAIEERLTYRRWYCGHWHINKDAGKVRFLFERIEEFGVGETKD